MVLLSYHNSTGKLKKATNARMTVNEQTNDFSCDFTVANIRAFVAIHNNLID